MKMKRTIHPALLAALSAVLAGCSTFHPLHDDAFIDDKGNVLYAVYGECSKPYTYNIVSPANGRELPCTEKKMVRIRLPDPNGSRVDCYICQNPFPKGTMYGTRDGKWKYLTIGVKSRLYLVNEERNDYLLVFEGEFYPAGSGQKGMAL